MAKRIDDLLVLDNKRISDDFFVLHLGSNSILPNIKPGQFLQVKVEGSTDTFLRRPISIHSVDIHNNTIDLLIQIVGNGTKVLSGLERNDILNIIYPLGNSFSIPEDNCNILLIGGGCGIAPLLYLGKYLKSKNFKPDILLGFRNQGRVIEYDEYKAVGEVYLTTEDGSQGEKGYVTSHSVLKDKTYDRIYCCGPESMMKAIASYCRQKGIFCEVSLENLMACGIGACLCCVVDTVKGHQCTCIEGPIFNINDLKW
jgi:dihydroorotate dehydrogenase electron transfer subunit